MCQSELTCLYVDNWFLTSHYKNQSKYVYLVQNRHHWHRIKKVWEESLNSDVQQFHQYQNTTNNHISSKIIEYKKNHDIYVRNPGPSLKQSQKVYGILFS
jgi:hypothetical protein